MSHILPQSFFNRSSVVVAQDLLGKVLYRRNNSQIITGIITETEAYDGPEDKASHAHRGKTQRNEVMFGAAGYWYIYLVYGMHWMLNVVTDNEDYPSAVLIRGTDMVCGPGRVTRYFSVNKKQNTLPAIEKSGLWIEDYGYVVSQRNIHKTPRIGVPYAGPVWSQKRYRFVVSDPSRIIKPKD